MKKYIMTLIPILLAYLLFTACEPDAVVPPADCPNPPCSDSPEPSKIGILDTLWSVPIEGGYTGTNHIVVISGVVYFSVGSSIIAYDAVKGEKLWRWDDQELGRHISFYICSKGESVFVQNFSDIASVDLVSGATIKRYRETTEGHYGAPRGALLGDFYYYNKRRSNKSKATLMRSHKKDMESWEEVYLIERGEDTGGSSANIESYNLWVNPNSGDSVIVFQHRMSIPNRVDVVAFSLNTREILWRHNDVNTSGNSNHQQMLVMNDKAYIMAAEVVIAYDMFTGDVVWEHFAHDLAIRFMFHKFGYAESINAILVKGNSHRLYGLDPETGEKNLFVEDAGIYSLGAGSPVYHDGIIYYTTATKLYAMRASTGQILWQEDSTMRTNSGFNGDIAIDKENGVLFAADGYYLYAIRAFED